ncbi:MAG TPA: ABC transporter substrate-binding protein [Casimicrobiaceae bacterium]|nr:ABC transporter substrate-binding protein [Casimicrobiaceae bacterium]
MIRRIFAVTRIALIACATVLAAQAASAQSASNEHSSNANGIRTLRVAFPVAETGFDPQATSDLYSDHVQRAIFETLYGFDYLARPYRRIPRTAAELPRIEDGGRSWTIRVRPGIYFADDAAFGGKRRELTAADYVYSWKRLLDPKVRSPFSWYLQGKIVGADAIIERARASGKFDYDAPMEGLYAPDRYTIRIRLLEPDYILFGYLCSSPMSAVAREVIERYGDDNGWTMDHPVGTGAFMLKSWRRGQQIVLEANPNFRDERFPRAADDADRARFSNVEGRKLPLVDRVEISIMEEANPRLLAFDARALDYVNLPPELADHALDGQGTLKRDYAARGVALARLTQPSLQYAYFNMQDPVVGGYTNDRIALRRALALAFNNEELIRVVYQGQAMPATQLIPPNVPGHDDALDVSTKYDPAAARSLLDKFGYVDRNGDGWRDLPDGRPLSLVMASTPTTRDREIDEIWQKNLKAIGIRVEFMKQKWPDLLKMGKAGQLQLWRIGWINAYAEGDAFAQLLYGKNIGQTNYARFDLPAYDALYRQSRMLPDGPERNRLYRAMSELVAAYNPWLLHVYTVESTLTQPWVRGYKKHAYWEHPWLYMGVDSAKLAAR